MNLGDIVMLKSGGPRMTVIKLGNEMARCAWFDKNDISSVAEYPEIALEVITRESDREA